MEVVAPVHFEHWASLRMLNVSVQNQNRRMTMATKTHMPRRFLFVEILKLFPSERFRFAVLVVLCITVMACTLEGNQTVHAITDYIAHRVSH